MICMSSTRCRSTFSGRRMQAARHALQTCRHCQTQSVVARGGMLRLCRLADVSDNLDHMEVDVGQPQRLCRRCQAQSALATGCLLLHLCRPTSPASMSATAAHWLWAHRAHMQRLAGHGVMFCSHWARLGHAAPSGALLAGYQQAPCKPHAVQAQVLKAGKDMLVSCQCRNNE